MGNKAPKSKFEKFFGLLNDPDTVAMAWSSVTRLTLNADELAKLEAFAGTDVRRMADLFDPMLALVKTPADAIVMVQKFPNDNAAWRIMRVICQMPLTEADVVALSDAWPAWGDELITDLLNKQNGELRHALQNLADAEEERDDAKEDLGFVSAQAVEQNHETEEILARAEAALAKSEQLVAEVAEARTGYEEAEVAYNNQLRTVDGLQESVTSLSNRLHKGNGRLRKLIPDISTQDMMEAARYMDQVQVQPADEDEDNSGTAQPADPALAQINQPPADQDEPQDSHQHEPGSDTSVWEDLGKLRIGRLARRIRNFANSDEPAFGARS